MATIELTPEQILEARCDDMGLSIWELGEKAGFGRGYVKQVFYPELSTPPEVFEKLKRCLNEIERERMDSPQE